MERQRRQQDNAALPGGYSDFYNTVYPTDLALHPSNPNDWQCQYYTDQEFSYNYYESNYVYGQSQSSSSSQASASQESQMATSVPPRVHINPNYRPRANLVENETSAIRPSSVHINPHWKPRVGPASTVDCGSHANYISNECLGKKTIFVNPKVLAQMKDKSNGLDMNYSMVDRQTLSKGTSCEARTTHVTQFEEPPTTEKKSAPSIPTLEPTFVVLNSRKLVRKSNLTAHVKSISLNQEATNIFQSHNSNLCKAREISKKIMSPCTSTLKIAKQLSSKYKLVRNSSFVPSPIKNFRGANSSRRLKKRSASTKLPHPSHHKSQYKFVRKTEPLEVSTKVAEMKQVKMVVSLPSSSQVNSKTRSQFNFKASPRPNTNLRTRYKLIKIQPCNQKSNVSSAENKQEKKTKTIKSRYKLVRMSLTESNSSSKGGVPVNRRRLSGSISKIFTGNKVAQGRKISRFKVIDESGFSKFKKRSPQYLVQICKSHLNCNPKKMCARRAGFYGNIIWQKGKIISSPHLKLDRRASLSIASKKRKYSILSSNKSCNRNLLNISGVLYKSTRTTLTRTVPKESKEKILHIRGKRYVLDAKGTTLRPSFSENVTEQEGKSKAGIFSRVDIGGVTFTRRSDNTLVRTNTHHTRNLLSSAKTKSIALLTQKLRKNNQPCLIYHRFGKCYAHEEGKCWRVHDPKNISICRKFLQGSCEVENCLLSHAVGPEKMPTCKYFLEGCCVRDNCPYLHVKLSSHAAICRQFLHGYCAAGDTCEKRHVNLCPDFEQSGKCSKGKYCPYPHQDKTKSKPKRGKANYAAKELSLKGKTLSVSYDTHPDSKLNISCDSEIRKRYYDRSTSCGSAEGQSKCLVNVKDSEVEISSLSDGDNDSHVGNEVAKRRTKLGILPAYIPL